MSKGVTRRLGTWKPGTALVIDLRGVECVPKGSMRAFVVKGRAIVNDAKSMELRALERDIRLIAARELDRLDLPCADHQPFELLFVFYLARPAAHFTAGAGPRVLRPLSPPAPITKPDYDKLARGATDPLIGLVFHDDSCVTRAVIEKRYATAERDIGLWIKARVLPGTIMDADFARQASLKL